ncbi:conserved hypothetical protein [Candidatus Brocadia pituitae]|nr:conserved hypothetical protein [Candidatus Brocadia pituitae]
MVKEASAWLKEAGVETSHYLLMGLGGRDHWRRHIQEAARLINATAPEFVRIRRLWPYESNSPFSGPESPLLHEIRTGNFIQQTPEGTVLELRLLIEQIHSISTFVTYDHGNNYVQVSGRINEDKQTMLAKIDAFLALPEREREAHYLAVGSRI